MDESEILNDARLYDELEVDDAWAADSDSGDSGEEEADEEEDSDDGDAAAQEEDDADEGVAEAEDADAAEDADRGDGEDTCSQGSCPSQVSGRSKPVLYVDSHSLLMVVRVSDLLPYLLCTAGAGWDWAKLGNWVCCLGVGTLSNGYTRTSPLPRIPSTKDRVPRGRQLARLPHSQPSVATHTPAVRVASMA